MIRALRDGPARIPWMLETYAAFWHAFEVASDRGFVFFE